jgi:hypothetical protein
MDGPRVPRNDAALQYALARIFEDVTLTQGDIQAVVRFMNEELPRFEQADDSYLVLGSYRDDYGIRLRKFAHRLNMPTNAESIVLGDTIDLDTDLEFDIKLNLLGEAADYIAGIYEKEDGGEHPELGFVRALFARKTHVFPRDYAGLSREALETRADVITAALEIYYAEYDDEDDQRADLLALLTVADEEGIDIDERELVDVLLERKRELDEEPAGYSWVHLSLFRRFERMNQCYPWRSMTELLEQAAMMPRQARPHWEREYDPAEFDIENSAS